MIQIKVKIITMYCGESEFEQCVEMVNSQKCDFIFDQVFIKNKANAEAHNELYKIIMDESDVYDYFVKLDADMVLNNETALQRLMTVVTDSDADIFSIPVHDYMTDSMIWGLNVYRSGVKWLLGTDDLFTDQQRLNGKFISAKKNLTVQESLVSHAEDPNEFQAFVFGVHRASKVIQSESYSFLLGHAWGQINTLFKVVEAYNKSNEIKRAYAIIGAYYTLKKLNKRVGLFSKEDFIDEFKAVRFDSDLVKSLIYFRRGKLYLLFDSVGVSRVLIGFFDYTIRRLK